MPIQGTAVDPAEDVVITLVVEGTEHTLLALPQEFTIRSVRIEGIRDAVIILSGPVVWGYVNEPDVPPPPFQYWTNPLPAGLYHAYLVGSPGVMWSAQLGIHGPSPQVGDEEPWSGTAVAMQDLVMLPPEVHSPVILRSASGHLQGHGAAFLFVHYEASWIGVYASAGLVHVASSLTQADCGPAIDSVVGLGYRTEAVGFARFPADAGNLTASWQHATLPPSYEFYREAFAAFVDLHPDDPSYSAQSPWWSLLWRQVPVTVPSEVQTLAQSAACVSVPLPQ
jgi:hypothetical protein